MSDESTRYASAAHFRLVHGDTDRTVVLLHGLGGDHRQPWALTTGRVANGVATRLAPDARAHGETSLSDLGPLDFATLAGDVRALVSRLDLPSRLVLVGVSMGAATALRLALDRPGDVEALVLVRPAWLDVPEPANLAVFGEVASLLREHGTHEGRRLFASSPGYLEVARRSASVAASLLEQFDKPLALERVRRLEELPRSVPYRERAELGSVRAPTLVIGAEGDPVHPMAYAEELSALIAGARLVEVPPRDRSPEAFGDALREATTDFVAGC